MSSNDRPVGTFSSLIRVRSWPHGRVAAAEEIRRPVWPPHGHFLAWFRLPVQHFDDLLAHPAGIGAELLQHLRGDALALADQAKQDVLGADVVVAEPRRLVRGKLKHRPGLRADRDGPGHRPCPARAGGLQKQLPDDVPADPEALKYLHRAAVALASDSEQDVLGADGVIVPRPGFFLCQGHHPARPVGKALEHRLPRSVVAVLPDTLTTPPPPAHQCASPIPGTAAPDTDADRRRAPPRLYEQLRRSPVPAVQQCHLGSRLSGGHQQRLRLWRALILWPG